MIAVSFVLTYVGMVALYHARRQRAAAWLTARLRPAHFRYLRWSGVTLLCLAAVSSVMQTGVARGLSIWLGILGLCAAVSLVFVTLRPRWHLLSPLGVVGAAVLLEIGRVVV